MELLNSKNKPLIQKRHNMSSWKTDLKNALQLPLPGLTAQNKMAPSSRQTADVSNLNLPPIQSSVLILLHHSKEGITIPFIQRPLYDGPHSGQISLPGGKQENIDKNNWETALRETREELGIETGDIEFLGELTQLYIPHSNFYVSPQVGYIHKKLKFNPCPFEVSEIIEASAYDLLTQNYKTKNINNRGVNIEAPYYEIKDKHIWGATAMVISELIEIFNTRAPYWANALRSYNDHISPKSP